jgi:hypothetical protein
MLARATVLALLVALALVGCDNPPASTDAGSATPDTGEADAGPPDMGTDAGPPPHDFCAEMMIPRIPFDHAASGTTLGSTIGDFTAQTTDGPWQLSRQWSGCESYVFFVNFPGYNDDVFTTAFDQLLLEGPRNVHYFVMSDDVDPAARMAFAAAQEQTLLGGFDLQGISPEDQAFWRSHFHFVTDQATAVHGSVGTFLTSYLAYARMPSSGVDLGGGRGTGYPPRPTVFGITRAQEIDGGDNLSPAVGSNDALGTAAYLGHFYNYRGALEARLAGETGVTTVSLLSMTTTGRTFTQAVTLPDAATMAAFDTMQIDVTVDCTSGNPFACSEWDRIADVQLCVDGMPCTDRREIGRWITPYWRRGRQHYLLDASAFLGLVRAGGAQTFFIELGPDWERATQWDVSVSLRLSTRGGAPVPTGAERAFTGGTFDANYNTAHTPFTFTPPAGTTRVEIVSLLTGHGQGSTTQCAEWCDHQHTFSVNGTALPTIHHTGVAIGSPFGCAARATAGVIPGQWGNWPQERAYWCPGLQVDPIHIDITSMVHVGMPNTLGYQGGFRGGAPVDGDIDLSAYVVYYR